MVEGFDTVQVLKHPLRLVRIKFRKLVQSIPSPIQSCYNIFFAITKTCFIFPWYPRFLSEEINQQERGKANK